MEVTHASTWDSGITICSISKNFVIVHVEEEKVCSCHVRKLVSLRLTQVSPRYYLTMEIRMARYHGSGLGTRINQVTYSSVIHVAGYFSDNMTSSSMKSQAVAF